MSEAAGTVGDRYALATGEAGAARLRLLHAVYGPATVQLFSELGMGPGWRVADFGCGIGSISLWTAARVAPGGSVVGIDVAAGQVAIARRRVAEAGLANATFVEASVYNTGLPEALFDLAHSRFVLNHLKDPVAALREMIRVVKPGGWVMCEETDVTTLLTDPPSEAYRLFVDLFLKYSQSCGTHYRLGPSLHRLFREQGIEPTVRFSQPIHMTGEERRLWEYSFLEATPALLQSGLIGEEELRHHAAELTRDTLDETRLIAPPLVFQVWGRKP